MPFGRRPIVRLSVNPGIRPDGDTEIKPDLSKIQNDDLKKVFAYIDARDLGHMVDCCLGTDGLGYEVFNVANDDMSVGMTSDEVYERF